MKIDCLDKGFVELIDTMGTDTSIVEAARISTGSKNKTPEQDRQLIRYLMRNKHTSPFEMCELKFHIKMPIFVMRQWVRHRTANLNEVSGRYSEIKDEFYLPELENICKQGKINKQGSEDIFDNGADVAFRADVEASARNSFVLYQTYLAVDVARETARIALPLNTYTEIFWKMDLRNLLHFIMLRIDPHAQYEIRVYAEALAEIVKAKFPVTWEAFNEYVLNAVTFSGTEVEILNIGIADERAEALYEGLSKSERIEFDNKLKKLGWTENNS